MTILSIPKIDLHCHLDGSVRPTTLFDLLREHSLPIAADSVKALLPLIQVPDECPSLVAYLERFQYPLRVMQTKAALHRIAREFMEDCHGDGLSYVEVRFAPILHTSGGLSFEAVVESVLEGLQEGHRSTGIPFGLILCAMRHQSPEETLRQIRQSAPYLKQGVVAVDLAGDEAGYPPLLHQKTFETARELGFKITIHAGETGSWENILNSVEKLGADRIGHGVAAEKNPALVELLRDRQIPLEMCPTSNIQTKSVLQLSEHPILRYLHEGLAVTLNTDNRTVSGVTSTSEQMRLQAELNATDSELVQLAGNSIRAAFVSDEVRRSLMRKLYDTTAV